MSVVAERLQPIDQSVSVSADAVGGLSFQSAWSALENAAREGRVDGYTAMSELGKQLGAVFFPSDSPAAADLVANLANAQQDNRVVRFWFEGRAAKLPVEFVTLPDATVSACAEHGVVIPYSTLGLHDRVELIRATADVERSKRRTEVSKDDPLRVLIVVANPAVESWPLIPRAEPQGRAIEAACRSIGGDTVAASLVTACTRQSLTESLAATRPHILHFVGHGAKESTDVPKASLVLHGDDGRSVDLLSSEDLFAMFESPPELITLNACHLGGADSVVGGFAASLAEAGVNLVLAQQLPVQDTVAEHIAEGVYRPFLRGLPLSMALASIRRQIAIDNRRLHSPEWATPVLYSRVGDTARFAGISARGIADARAGAGANQFIGREWLWGKVSERLETPDKTVTLLVADGGMGKSSFVEFCRRRVETSVEAADEADASAPLLLDYRYHYGERADGLSCAQSLSRQLRRWLQDNGRAVPNEPPPDAHGSPFARACKVLNRLVLEVATHTKTILFIDALDEATDPAEALPIAAILDDLPDNLAVFATTRPEWYAKWRAGNDVEAVDDEAGHDKRFSVITLEPLSTPNLQDIALFLQNTFAPYRIGMSATECLSLANDVGGSFLVADILCGMLRTGDDKTLVQDRFKQANSVTGAYDLVFRTLAADLANDPEAERRLRDTEDLLALISCSQDALSEEQLRYLFDARDGAESVDASDALAVAMSHLRRFLSSDLTASGEALFRPYHQSLRAYGERRLGVKALSSAPDSKPQQPNTNTVPPRGLEQGAKRPLPRSPQEYRQLWADYCLRWPELEQYPRTYALRHLVPHLLMLDDDQAALEIERVLTDYAYIAAALGADPSKPDRPLDVNELISRYESVESKVAR